MAARPGPVWEATWQTLGTDPAWLQKEMRPMQIRCVGPFAAAVLAVASSLGMAAEQPTVPAMTKTVAVRAETLEIDADQRWSTRVVGERGP